jgi:hypothetical protein
MADLEQEFQALVEAFLELTSPPQVKWVDNPHVRGSHKRWAWNFLKVCHARYSLLLHKFDGINPDECEGMVGALQRRYGSMLENIDLLIHVLNHISEKDVTGVIKKAPISDHPLHDVG